MNSAVSQNCSMFLATRGGFLRTTVWRTKDGRSSKGRLPETLGWGWGGGVLRVMRDSRGTDVQRLALIDCLCQGGYNQE